MKLRTRNAAIFVLPLVLLAAAADSADYLADGKLDYGEAHLDIPPAIRVNHTTPRTVQMLEDALSDALPGKRAQLVVEIGMCDLPESIAAIRRTMSDENPMVRAAAADAAALLGRNGLRDDVARLLQDDDPQVRRSAALAFAALDDGETSPSPAVVDGLADQHALVRAAAIRAVTTHQDARLLLDRLADRNAAGQDAQGAPQAAVAETTLQAEAFRALARVGFTDAADTIHAAARQSAADDPAHLHLPLRSAAIEALGSLRATQHAHEILQDLQHPHPTIRRQVLRAVRGLVAPAEQQAIAMRMIEDPDPTVRQAAVEVLGRLPTTDAIAALVRQLDDPYDPLFRAARAALLADGTESYRQQVIGEAVALLTHANPRRREDGSYLLGMLRSDQGMEQHIALLVLPEQDFANTDWAVLRQAAESTGLIGDSRAVEPIAALLPLWREGARHFSPPELRQGDAGAAAEAILIAAARLGYEPAVQEYALVLRGDPQEQPSSQRAVALWGTGILAPATSAFTSRCLGVYNSQWEGSEAKFEAIKALGNQRASGGRSRTAAIRNTETNPEMRWIAHWAHDRITGQQTPYSPPEHPWVAPVSIVDLEPRLSR